MKEIFQLCKGDAKPFLTIEQQLDLLKSRGLIVPDEENAKDILRRTNYYRLSGYSLTLRSDDVFNNGVTFDLLYEIYRFDDAFRKLILNYSSYIEIEFRSFIAYYHAGKYGPLGYLDAVNFEKPDRHAAFIEKITEEINRSDDVFVYHHKRDKSCVFPLWAAVECSSFGDLSKMFKNLKSEDRTTISKTEFGIPREYVENWLQATVFARNIAAHGGRFYYRKLRSVQIKLPNKLKSTISGDTAFAVIYAIYKLQPTRALASGLIADLNTIFKKYPNADISCLGFVSDWETVLRNNETNYAFEYKKR